jgi:hypothetical protein
MNILIPRFQLTQAVWRKEISEGGGHLNTKWSEEGDIDAATATKQRASILWRHYTHEKCLLPPLSAAILPETDAPVEGML